MGLLFSVLLFDAGSDVEFLSFFLSFAVSLFCDVGGVIVVVGVA